MKTYTQACRERAEKADDWHDIDPDDSEMIRELCNRLDRAVAALKHACDKCKDSLADELERL